MTHPARQAMMDKAIAQRQHIKEWLLPHMAGGRAKAFTKEQYRQLSVAALGIFSKSPVDPIYLQH